MTKNTIGGKGHKRAKKQIADFKNVPLKDNNNQTDYALVLSVLGNGRMKVLCLSDKIERLGHIRGALYKKTWIAKDDIVLISKRDFQDGRCDIIFKYSPEEIKTLIKNGEIDRYYNNDRDEKSEDELIFIEEDENEKENQNENNEEELDIDDI